MQTDYNKIVLNIILSYKNCLELYKPSFEQTDTKDKREKQFVLFKQRATYILVDAIGEVVVETLYSFLQVVGLLAVVDCLS